MMLYLMWKNTLKKRDFVETSFLKMPGNLLQIIGHLLRHRSVMKSRITILTTQRTSG